MDRIFTTADVHPRNRFEYWHDVACKTILLHEAKPESRLEFQGQICKSTLDNVDLIAVDVSPLHAERTADVVAREPEDCFLVFRPVEGEVLLNQEERQCKLLPGDIAIMDALQPASATCLVQSKMLLLKVPRSALVTRLGHLRGYTARSLRESSIGAFAADQLAVLPSYAGVIDQTAQAATASYVVDLIAMAAAKVVGEKPRRSDLRALAASRLRACIDARLDDANLDPAAAAAAAGLSVRYAQALLAEQGTSIMRLIQQRRIERCKSALADPAQDHRTVGDIAFSWGFADLTHFSRVFKAQVGMTPGEFRRERASGGRAAAGSAVRAGKSAQDR